ncbi:MAG: hypothetical protein M1816_001115 [Peltula sp. TS41687]|nr:MAG: hypothetical protein M1816_001115 [Peltula sp. TS41687]
MSPRLPISLQLKKQRQQPQRQQRRHASTSSAAAAAAAMAGPSTMTQFNIPQQQSHHPPTQPPSFKPPEYRKSQLHRQYTSLLRSTPLMLLFQHNNVKSIEWMAIRRELLSALRRCDAAAATTTTTSTSTSTADLAPSIKLHTVQVSIFSAALRVAEHFHPSSSSPSLAPASSTSTTSTTPPRPVATTQPQHHGLSAAAHASALTASQRQPDPLAPLLAGPIAVLAFPSVSPEHLKAALSVLAPAPHTAFAAPTRRANPAYYDPVAQAGLGKLVLLGARVEGDVLDPLGVRRVGVIEGGVDGLRARLVGLLRGAAGGVVGVLQAPGRALWVACEGRRGALQEEEEEGRRGGGGISRAGWEGGE